MTNEETLKLHMAALGSDAAAENLRLRAALRDVVDAYDFCSADPADRGYSVLDSAICDARPLLNNADPR